MGSRFCSDQSDRPKQARRHRFDLVEILHLKAVPIFCDQRFVIMRWQSCPGIDGGVVDLDHNMIVSRFKKPPAGSL